MAYKSLFEDVIAYGTSDFDSHSRYVECSLPLETIIGETRNILFNGFQNVEDRVRIVLNPPRMIRAVMDHKIETPLADYSLVADSIALGLAIYSRDPRARKLIDKYEEAVEKESPRLLDEKLKQEADAATWIASHPIKSRFSAGVLAKKAKEKDILLIALAHGGVAAGMDVFLNYTSLTGSRKSKFYATRLSVNKIGDLNPRLNAQEKEMLAEEAKKREVVIFDEDSCTGNTIAGAQMYFENLFKKQVITRVNYWPGH
ncbi:MAG TPA: hypothetical protein VHA12_03450 [Candidatus Nanoarchaeia archaeon]|nr:hypothetical protein [Candidatus Nanoarchaeia archaeon]